MNCVLKLLFATWVGITTYSIALTNIKEIPLRLEEGECHYTHYWAVEMPNTTEAEAKEIAERHGFEYISEILPEYFYLRHNRVSKRSIYPSVYYHDRLEDEPKVKWIEQQIARKRVKRNIHFNDPYWPDMWFLNRWYTDHQYPDMNVIPVWKRGFTGQGVVVTIIDDGLEKDHIDLKSNYDPRASYDVINNDDNPEPRYIHRKKDTELMKNQHGTRCAGLVAATANNSFCGLGIAYNARIGGVRMLDGDVTDAIEARSLGFNSPHIDIYSSSWGPDDNGATVEGPNVLAQKAFNKGISEGRGGLGSIYIFASGNGGRKDDNCNCDGYTNSIYTISVGAMSEPGGRPWYAEFCSSTMAVTFSSGEGSEKSVITTDLNDKCTRDHSGTSASAPMAAGIIALVLSANRRLNWRDVQHLIVRTARPYGKQFASWDTNGVGREFSHYFGFGLLDAAAMVDLALNWTTVPPQHFCEVPPPDTTRSVSMGPNSKEVLSRTTNGCMDQEEKKRVRYLEHVQAKVYLEGSIRGEVELWLISPMGTVSKLLKKRVNDNKAKGFYGWPFMSVHFWGEKAEGTWKLTIWSGGASVTVRSFRLDLYGTDRKPPYHSMTSESADTDTGTRDRKPRNGGNSSSSLLPNYFLILILLCSHLLKMCRRS